MRLIERTELAFELIVLDRDLLESVLLGGIPLDSNDWNPDSTGELLSTLINYEF